MITGFSHTVQLSVFLKSVGAGYVLGLLFFLMSFLNAIISKKDIFVFFRDLLFFISSAVFSFLFMLKYNAGIVRFYILAGELIGFILCYIFPGSAFGKWIGGISEKISSSTDKIKKKLKNFFIKQKLKNDKKKKGKVKKNNTSDNPKKNKKISERLKKKTRLKCKKNKC